MHSNSKHSLINNYHNDVLLAIHWKYNRRVEDTTRFLERLNLLNQYEIERNELIYQLQRANTTIWKLQKKIKKLEKVLEKDNLPF